MSAEKFDGETAEYKTYPTESQLRNAVAQYETWHDLVAARFPEYPALEDERPYDPRSDHELTGDHNRTGKNLLWRRRKFGKPLPEYPRPPTKTVLTECRGI